eukprot:Gb_03713 [translate_table: standard]
MSGLYEALQRGVGAVERDSGLRMHWKRMFDFFFLPTPKRVFGISSDLRIHCDSYLTGFSSFTAHNTAFLIFYTDQAHSRGAVSVLRNAGQGKRAGSIDAIVLGYSIGGTDMATARLSYCVSIVSIILLASAFFSVHKFKAGSHITVLSYNPTNPPVPEHVRSGKFVEDIEARDLETHSMTNLFEMLPKGRVPPSGPSPCHNSSPRTLSIHCRNGAVP